MIYLYCEIGYKFDIDNLNIYGKIDFRRIYMTYYRWIITLRKMKECWQNNIQTIFIKSNYQDVKITKSGTKLISGISGIRGMKPSFIIMDELIKE